VYKSAINAESLKGLFAPTVESFVLSARGSQYDRRAKVEGNRERGPRFQHGRVLCWCPTKSSTNVPEAFSLLSGVRSDYLSEGCTADGTDKM
jgi:hypothetical protein